MTILAAVITTSWWGWEVSEGYMSYRRWCDQHWGIVGERKNQSHWASVGFCGIVPATISSIVNNAMGVAGAR